ASREGAAGPRARRAHAQAGAARRLPPPARGAGGTAAVKDDSELLTGVFVVQLGFGTAQQVMASAAEWAARRTEDIAFADVLMQRGLLDEGKRKMVEALSGRALQVNGGDVARTLQSLSSGLKPLLTSISHSMISEPSATKESLTQSDSLEGSENI